MPFIDSGSYCSKPGKSCWRIASYIIIAATLLNKMSKDNVDYKIEFKLDYGSKWSFVPVSLKMKHDVSIVSNSAILSKELNI